MSAVAAMQSPEPSQAARYARSVELSKKSEWQIDRDLLRGRTFDFSRKFLPDGLSQIDRLAFLSEDEACLLSQIQGRTYAYIFGLVERFISAKMLDQGRAHIFDDQIAVEALVRFSNEELKHQELFRRMEAMIGAQVPSGYRQVANPNDVARAVLAASPWSVLALTCHIELFVQAHYAQSIAPREELCPLFKDVFKFHWKDEGRHVVLDELEWKNEHAKLSPVEHDAAVDDLIALVAAVDGILQAQSASDADYFVRCAMRPFSEEERARIRTSVLSAYRWQYIISGVQHPHFGRLLASMTTPTQMAQIQAALAPIVTG
jgi:hypothetical protein